MLVSISHNKSTYIALVDNLHFSINNRQAFLINKIVSNLLFSFRKMKATVIFVSIVAAACLVAHTNGWLFHLNACSNFECQLGTCIQIGSTVMRTCHDELRKKRGTAPSGNNRYLYRVLREDENTNDDIYAKNMYATKTIQSHVGCGSRPNYESQYISCTTTYQAALEYGRLVVSGRGQSLGTVTIAVINRDALERDGHVVHDLSNAGRDVLPGVMARNFARRYDEALVEHRIPEDYIVARRHILLGSRNYC